ncbi:UvrD-helicase domain-containing protein [Rhodopirellula sp. JC740]|uniref:DNA 3'-5' helicase n=1 Tax=Rhodopirellula halodulae TaxID=2894198 RepID=A0ABS8NIE9_9BACT|nr:UvrD-helicase domain-containing protein [Rhodopirellula sp. JC740]MCC9643332.1 UvrD-helicase domain-containing protein [Rhodopirellula sp. JC740]
MSHSSEHPLFDDNPFYESDDTGELFDDINAQLHASVLDELEHEFEDATPDDWDYVVESPTTLREAFEPTLVRASAGTGKTYQLTARLLKILLTGASPETILATTFTRKAAGEILERVLITLGNAAIDPSEKALQALRQQVGIEGLPRHVCGQLFHRLLRNIHRVRICTLDSLFSQLARALPFELDLPPGWRLTDEVEEIWLRQVAIGNLIESLNPSETETLISMLSRGDVKRNVARELIDVVENTYHLSRQSDSERWDQLSVPELPDSAEITRVAGMFRLAKPPQKTLVKALESAADSLETRDFSPLVDATLIKNIAKARLTGEEVKFGRSKFPDGLSTDFDLLYEIAKHESLSLLRSQNHATGTVVDHYDTLIHLVKQTQRAFAFDDIAVRLADVFTQLDNATVQDRLDASIDHLLLDEFQDTSPVQWQVLRLLAEAVTNDASQSSSNVIDPKRSKSFFCVGDTKQAIYGWRGGVAEIFDAVDQQIAGVISKQQDESYRSSAVVLDSVTQAFQNLKRHPMADAPDPPNPADKSLYEAKSLKQFARRFPKHTAAKELPGYVQFRTATLKLRSETDEESGKPKKPTASEIADALLDDVAKQISELHHEAPHLTIGVLTRTNGTVGSLINRLEHLNVDVSAEGGNPLVDSVAVRWILSALLMCEHPGDGRWRLHIAHSPLQYVLPLGDKDGRERAADELRSRIEDQGLAKTILFLAKSLMQHCDQRETVRLEQLIELSTLYQHTAESRLRDFVELVHEKRVQRPRAAKVRVMTVHQSKGLEFDAVFLPELHKSLVGRPPQCLADIPEIGQPARGLSRFVGEAQWHFLPKRWQKVFGGSVASRLTEALCLLYVAMTRARQGLYLVTPPAAKSDFNLKTSASLLYHAWSCEADATTEGEMLYESGNANWFANDDVPTTKPTENDDIPSRRLTFV